MEFVAQDHVVGCDRERSSVRHGIPRVHREVHQELLELTWIDLDQPTRIMSTLKVLFDRQLKPTEVFLGAAESLAHLNCLIGQGRITQSIDADGVWTFRRRDADSAAA